MSSDEFSKQPQWFQDGMNHIQEWIGRARPKQLMPVNDDWSKWFMCGGRGSGKSFSGANNLFWLAFINPDTRWAVVAPTASDLKKVCFGGPSGLLSFIPDSCYAGGSQDKGYNKSDHIITLRNGSIIEGYSAETPSRLRGPQFHGAWCFPAGTKVMMANGSEKNIESVCVGDIVMTRNGAKKVLASGLTKKKAEVFRIDKGADVKEHKNKGFKNILIRIPMDILEDLDKLLRKKTWLNRTQLIIESLHEKLNCDGKRE